MPTKVFKTVEETEVPYICKNAKFTSLQTLFEEVKIEIKNNEV